MKIQRASSRPWRIHPATLSRVVLAAAMGCFYFTFSHQRALVVKLENIAVSNEEQSMLSLQQERPISVSTTNKIAEVVADNTNKEVSPLHIKFPGYPLTREGMLAVGAAMGRSAVPRLRQHDNQHFWCRPRPRAHTNFMVPHVNTTSEGLFFVKTPKTASQSINRILRRLTTRVHSDRTPCFLRAHHIQGDPAAWYSHRLPERSILLTSLRDPAPRALSRIYWTLSTRQFKGQVPPQVLKKALTTWTDVETGCVRPGGFQLNYVSFETPATQEFLWTQEQPTQVPQPDRVHDYVTKALQEYDFVLVQERLEESLVAMQLLLGLDTPDAILSMPLHVGGSYLYDRHAGCLELFSPPPLPHLDGPDHKHARNNNNNKTTPEAVQFLDDYFQSPTWYAQNYGDYVLWGAAQASLDRTIQDLQPEFNVALSQFKEMQQAVLEVCSRQVVFPCGVNGTIQRDDYQLGNPQAAGDRYPQKDIENCINQVVRERYS